MPGSGAVSYRAHSIPIQFTTKLNPIAGIRTRRQASGPVIFGLLFIRNHVRSSPLRGQCLPWGGVSRRQKRYTPFRAGP